jgi:hypothetical protein
MIIYKIFNLFKNYYKETKMIINYNKNLFFKH